MEWLGPVVAYWQGGIWSLLGWCVIAFVPPLLLLAAIGRQIAPRTLTPLSRMALLIGAGIGLVTVWIKQGLPLARQMLGL